MKGKKRDVLAQRTFVRILNESLARILFPDDNPGRESVECLMILD
jgi:hypothetical protein